MIFKNEFYVSRSIFRHNRMGITSIPTQQVPRAVTRLTVYRTLEVFFTQNFL